ncbi:MAG TPA: HD domain-containing phosphohydrolase [Verrucomicrobiae bacterium]|nr:HD domain-containing phosphohydrolase [Verrucomicrobiae bacterium]
MSALDCPPSKRVLVVDDEANIRALVQLTLERAGYTVKVAENAPRALELVHAEEFAVVITDYVMEPMNGLEFLKAVREIQPQCSRIMMTAFAAVDLMTNAIDEGKICRFLVKPWERDDLLAAVQEGSQHYLEACQGAAYELEAATTNERLKRQNASLEARLKESEAQNRELERLHRTLHENLQRSVELCLHAMQIFHPNLGSEARRVQALCAAMAEDLKLPAEQRRVLEISALLHDIGLLGMRRDLIDRWQKNPRELSEAETAAIQRHPVVGQELANFTEDLKDVGTVIRAHHERFDGTGYPDGLRGDEIPWLARLLSVAMGYAAYQSEGRDAAAAVTAARATDFDPEAVRALLRSLPQAALPRQQRGLLIAELKPGMVLASNVYNSQGMLIIPGGRPLNENWIAKLKAHDRVSPLNQYFQVYT